ncbi:MAG: HAD family hydrolase [Bulleidia sp.]
MSEKKIIFLDVDGTLIDYRAVMPESAGKAVDLARANGHLVYVCTGCSKAEVLSRNLCELDGMIGANGGYVEDHGEVIMHKSIPVEDVRRVVEWCDSRGLGAVLETNDGIFYSELMREQAREVYSKYAAGKGSTFEDAWKKNEGIEDRLDYLYGEDRYRSDINKIDFVLSSYQDFLDAKEEFSDMVANTWGGKDEQALFGDLSPKGILKANAIDVLLKHLGRSVEDTIAFGDAKIDISMFELCNYAVAMGNAGPETKEAADYVTTDVNDDGIWNAFQYLNLI